MKGRIKKLLFMYCAILELHKNNSWKSYGTVAPTEHNCHHKAKTDSKIKFKVHQF